MDNGCIEFGLSSPGIRTISEAAILDEASLRETRETGLDASVNARRPRGRLGRDAGLSSRMREVGLDASVNARRPRRRLGLDASLSSQTREVGLDESVTSRKSFRRSPPSASVRSRASIAPLSTCSASLSSQTREVGLDASVNGRKSFRRRSASRRVTFKDGRPAYNKRAHVFGKPAFDAPSPDGGAKPASPSRISIPMPAAIAPKTNLARMA